MLKCVVCVDVVGVVDVDDGVAVVGCGLVVVYVVVCPFGVRGGASCVDGVIVDGVGLVDVGVDLDVYDDAIEVGVVVVYVDCDDVFDVDVVGVGVGVVCVDVDGVVEVVV